VLWSWPISCSIPPLSSVLTFLSQKSCYFGHTVGGDVSHSLDASLFFCAWSDVGMKCFDTKHFMRIVCQFWWHYCCWKWCVLINNVSIGAPVVIIVLLCQRPERLRLSCPWLPVLQVHVQPSACSPFTHALCHLIWVARISAGYLVHSITGRQPILLTSHVFVYASILIFVFFPHNWPWCPFP
jgi:hypothetical protein